MTSADILKVDAEGAGFDPQRLERITDHLNQRYLQPGKIAGCQVLVARHDRIGYFRSLGSMDLERGKPVRDDTLWRIYSMSKPVTGVALMTLYERGLFQLSDPVSRFLPEFRDLKVAQKSADGSTELVEPHRPMSIRDVLMHTSGLGYEVMSDGSLGKGATLQTMVERLAERPLHFHPGSHWLYSVSTDICGRLVEVISGRSFDDYLREEIFTPLGMTDTGFVVADDDLERFAANYRRGPDKTLQLLDDPERSSYRRQPSMLSGGGGLVSTSADYLRFCQMLLGGGELDGVRVLGRKTVELMTSNHLPGGAQLRDVAMPGGYGEVGFDGVGFGLTMAVSLGPVPTQTVGSAGEFMWGGAASTIFWVDPAEDLIVVFMTQFMPSGTFNFRSQLKTLVYPAIAD